MSKKSYLSRYFNTMTIGNEYYFMIYSYDSSRLHKVTLELGSYKLVYDRVKGDVKTYFTIPLEWANAIPNATSMNGTLICETYESDYSTKIGSTDTEIVTFKIPAEIVPSLNITLEDTDKMLFERFGAHIQGKSTITYNINAEGSYGSTIISYKTSINDVIYTDSSFTTGIINSSGSKYYSTTITDSRGRTKTIEGYYKVLPYTKPKIRGFEVYRCNEDGTINDEGIFAKVVSNAIVDSVENKNTKEFKLLYKKIKDEEWTEIATYSGVYEFIDERIVNSFDINNSYIFKLEASDFFEKIPSVFSINSSDCIMDFHKSGNGMAIGKASENEGILDIGYKTRFTGGIDYIQLELGTNLDEITLPGFYFGEEGNFVNKPNISGSFTLNVFASGSTGQIGQSLTICNKHECITYQRFCYADGWGEWLSCFPAVHELYNNENGSNESTITLTENAGNYKYLEIYYMDNDFTHSSTKVYQPNRKCVDLSIHEIWEGKIYIKQKRVYIDGNTIQSSTWANTIFEMPTNIVIEGTDCIYITRIVGYK